MRFVSDDQRRAVMAQLRNFSSGAKAKTRTLRKISTGAAVGVTLGAVITRKVPRPVVRGLEYLARKVSYAPKNPVKAPRLLHPTAFERASKDPEFAKKILDYTQYTVRRKSPFNPLYDKAIAINKRYRAAHRHSIDPNAAENMMAMLGVYGGVIGWAGAMSKPKVSAKKRQKRKTKA